jgi:hypothetical protein
MTNDDHTTKHTNGTRELPSKSTNNLEGSLFNLLLDPAKPWVVVENGSLLGYFDYVPETLRVGPWSPLAPAMLFSMVYMVTYGLVLTYRSIEFEMDDDDPSSSYPPVLSPWWYYHVLGFLWISWISIKVWFGPVGPYAWATFTMWSWTILQLRHFLAAVAPWLQPKSMGMQLLELLHYPMLMMHSMTFVIWNLILM